MLLKFKDIDSYAFAIAEEKRLSQSQVLKYIESGLIIDYTKEDGNYITSDTKINNIDVDKLLEYNSYTIDELANKLNYGSSEIERAVNANVLKFKHYCYDDLGQYTVLIKNEDFEKLANDLPKLLDKAYEIELEREIFFTAPLLKQEEDEKTVEGFNDNNENDIQSFDIQDSEDKSSKRTTVKKNRKKNHSDNSNSSDDKQILFENHASYQGEYYNHANNYSSEPQKYAAFSGVSEDNGFKNDNNYVYNETPQSSYYQMTHSQDNNNPENGPHYTSNQLNHIYNVAQEDYARKNAQVYYDGVPVVSVSVSHNDTDFKIELNNPFEIRMFCDNIQSTQSEVLNAGNKNIDNSKNSEFAQQAETPSISYDKSGISKEKPNHGDLSPSRVQPSKNVIDYSIYSFNKNNESSQVHRNNFETVSDNPLEYKSNIATQKNNQPTIIMHLDNGKNIFLDEHTYKNIKYNDYNKNDFTTNNTLVANEIAKITDEKNRTGRFFSIDDVDDFSYSGTFQNHQSNEPANPLSYDKKYNAQTNSSEETKEMEHKTNTTQKNNNKTSYTVSNDDKTDSQDAALFNTNDSMYINSRMHERGSSAIAQIARTTFDKDIDPVQGAKLINQVTKYFRVSYSGHLAKCEAKNLIKFYEANNRVGILADDIKKSGIEKSFINNILRDSKGEYKKHLSHKDYQSLRTELAKKFSQSNMSLRSLENHNIPELENMLSELKSKNTGQLNLEERQLSLYVNLRKMEDASKHYNSKSMSLVERTSGLVMQFSRNAEFVQGFNLVSPYLNMFKKISRYTKKRIRTINQSIVTKTPVIKDIHEKKETRRLQQKEDKLNKKRTRQENRRKLKRQRQNKKRLTKEEKYHKKTGKNYKVATAKKRAKKARSIQKKRVKVSVRGKNHLKKAEYYREKRLKITRASRKFKAAKNVVTGDTTDRLNASGSLFVKLIKKLAGTIGAPAAAMISLVFLLLFLVVANGSTIITTIDSIIPDFDLPDEDDENKNMTYIQSAVNELIQKDQNWKNELNNLNTNVYEVNKKNEVQGGQDPITGVQTKITSFSGNPKIYFFNAKANSLIKNANQKNETVSLDDFKGFAQIPFRTNAKDIVSCGGQYKLLTDCSVSEFKEYVYQLWDFSHVYTTGISDVVPCPKQNCNIKTVPCYDKKILNSRKDFNGKNYSFLNNIGGAEGCITYYCNDKTSYDKAVFKKENVKATHSEKIKGCKSLKYDYEFNTYCKWQTQWNPSKLSDTIDIDMVQGVTDEIKQGYSINGSYQDEAKNKNDIIGSIDECSFSSKIYNNRKIKKEAVLNECINHNITLVMIDKKPVLREWNNKNYWVGYHSNMSLFNSSLEPIDGYFLVEPSDLNKSDDGYILNVATYQNNPIWFYACQGHTAKSRTFFCCTGHNGCTGHNINYCLGHCSLEIYASISGVTEDEITCKSIKNTILGVDNDNYLNKIGKYDKSWSGFDDNDLDSVMNKYNTDWEDLYNISSDTFIITNK